MRGKWLDGEAGLDYASPGNVSALENEILNKSLCFAILVYS